VKIGKGKKYDEIWRQPQKASWSGSKQFFNFFICDKMVNSSSGNADRELLKSPNNYPLVKTKMFLLLLHSLYFVAFFSYWIEPAKILL